ncbi:MAG: DUF871 domain-containing protein, partial [Lactobacillus sp.]|nr:DUF871 domain-containing protein [Lactobacillus sp.]
SNPVERTIAVDCQHVRRGDITERVVRSTEVRKQFAAEANAPHDNTRQFERGDVVVGNDDFGKYKNELQVVLEPHTDARKNLIGHISQAELPLLDFVGPWTKFKFEERK